ncbi:sulfotransferase 1C4-like [Pollicipes pollicipes]|uniref:sulfotransferase 1C4-like n=1 Tax=Pollicipes pollicipes TaxID=41117 RepID=UPI001884B073|nr:sulfotransferase 1C4-like [Pollicipes pollicipes]XP_037090163.1 sulfotransferase 1C4-like [Pollicipes pollicipes]
MSTPDKKAFPYKIIPLESETQKAIARDFAGYPNGLASVNHWGFKLSATSSPKEIENLYNYPRKAGDVWVVTPPKSGTTWTQEMVWLIANDLDYDGAKRTLSERWDFLRTGALTDGEKYPDLKTTRRSDAACQQPSDSSHCAQPRFVKTHWPLSMIHPRVLDVCKVVYVARNPKDVCVSFYHHSRLMKYNEFHGDMQAFMEYFMEGLMVATPVIEHMIEAWNMRHHPNICFIFFEDMKRDLQSEIRRVAEFLGKSLSCEQVDELAEHLHFDNFKKNPYVNKEEGKTSGDFHVDRGDFIRKGKIGDWKNHFTPEMSEKFDKWMAEKLKGTDLSFTMEDA